MTTIRKGTPEWERILSVFGPLADAFDFAEVEGDSMELRIDGPAVAVTFDQGDFVISGPPAPGEYARARLGRSS